MAQELTKEEQTFALRMLPHLSAGLSFEDAARAVLCDDERILSAFADRQTHQFVPTHCEIGRSHTTRIGKGDVIASELSRTVYELLRAA